MVTSGRSGERWLLAVEGDAGSALLASRKNSCEDAIKLLDRKIFADVAIRAGAQSGMHLLFVITDAGENDDWKCRIRFSHERDERDSVYLRHLKIDNSDLAVVLR